MTEFRAWSENEEPDTENLLAKITCDLDFDLTDSYVEQVMRYLREEFFDETVGEEDIIERLGFAYAVRPGRPHYLALQIRARFMSAVKNEQVTYAKKKGLDKNDLLNNPKTWVLQGCATNCLFELAKKAQGSGLYIPTSAISEHHNRKVKIV